MAFRIQRVLLNALCGGLCLASSGIMAAETSGKNAPSMTQLDNEQFELGFTFGLLNIQDFGSELALGISAGFIATEDVFMQLNYLTASAELSSFELNQGPLFTGSDRDYQHLDFLVGYNLYQGEQFFSGTRANLSSLYVVGGIGDTKFGGEESFTYTYGIGYQVALSRQLNVKLDYRSYIYDSGILLEDESSQNGLLSMNISYLF